MENDNMNIPQIVATRIFADLENECVTFNFLKDVEKDDVERVENIVGQLNVPFGYYLEFALTFLDAGNRIQKDLGVNLGIELPIDVEEGE